MLACLCPRSECGVGKTTHGRTLLHTVPQIPLAMPQPRRSWRPGLRAQPACPPRFAADVTSSQPLLRGSPGNYGQSHRCTGRTVSLAEVCGTVTPAPLRLTSGTGVVCYSARYGEDIHPWMLKKRMFGSGSGSSIKSVSPFSKSSLRMENRDQIRRIKNG